MDNAPKNTCLHCGEKLIGRADKKFCDQYCRNNYNNQSRTGKNTYIRSVNSTLRKNRRILEDLISNKRNAIKCDREELLLRGFQFKYLTHTYTNRKGDVYYYCYDFGYLPLENDKFLIVKEQKEEK